MKKILIGFILGIILGSGIVYAATLYKATDVSYEPSDASWEVDNVNEAINDLHAATLNSTSDAQLVEVGTSRSFNIKEIVGEEHLDKYSASDFVVVGIIPSTTGYGEVRDLSGAKGYGTVSEETAFTISYDETTGDVTITGGTLLLRTGVIKSSGSASGSLNTSITKNVKVYMLVKTPNANI